LVLIVATAALMAGSTGCATGGPTGWTIPAGDYAQAFQATKETLRRRGFTLDRVDARGGVIITAPAESAGLATPWSRTEGSPAGEIASFLHRDRRRVTVRFAPDDADEPEAGGVDRMHYVGPITASVVVEREIIHRPGFHLSSTGVRLSSVSSSTAGAERIIVRSAGEDRALAHAIAAPLIRRFGAPRTPAEEESSGPSAEERHGG